MDVSSEIKQPGRKTGFLTRRSTNIKSIRAVHDLSVRLHVVTHCVKLSVIEVTYFERIT
jgi:hypothetical protein